MPRINYPRVRKISIIPSNNAKKELTPWQHELSKCRNGNTVPSQECGQKYMTTAFHKTQKRRTVVLDLFRQKSDFEVFHRRPASTEFPVNKTMSYVCGKL